MATKAKTAKPVDSKVFDNKAQILLNRLIYAAQKDIENSWNSEHPFSPNMFQSYDNLIKDKEHQGDGLKGRFAISDQAKQFITVMFSKMICEIKNIELVENDTIETMRTKLTDANFECYADFMFNLAATLRGEFRATLIAAGDPTMWFRAQICGMLPKYATSERIISLISAEFNDFLKAMAWLLAVHLWYKPGTVDKGLFLATIAQQGMGQEMIDVLSDGLREKPPTKPRVTKKKTTTDEQKNSEETTENAPDNVEHTEVAETTEVDSALAAVLNLV